MSVEFETVLMDALSQARYEFPHYRFQTESIEGDFCTIQVWFAGNVHVCRLHADLGKSAFIESVRSIEW